MELEEEEDRYSKHRSKITTKDESVQTPPKAVAEVPRNEEPQQSYSINRANPVSRVHTVSKPKRGDVLDVDVVEEPPKATRGTKAQIVQLTPMTENT